MTNDAHRSVDWPQTQRQSPYERLVLGVNVLMWFANAIVWSVWAQAYWPALGSLVIAIVAAYMATRP